MGIFLGVKYYSRRDYEKKYVSGSHAVCNYGGYLGARYFFSDNIAAFGEIGYGLGLITLGATMTF